MRTQRLVLIGFGNVGRAFASLLLAKSTDLNRVGISARVVAVATRSHGALLAPEGVDLERALELANAGRDLSALSTAPAPADPLELIAASQGEVLFENTPVDYQSGRPAIDHLRAGLEAGMHAITANKGPVVHAHAELAALADRVGRRFLFESTVMDGAPVFSLWRETLPLAHLRSFRGVLNSTTNLMLTRVEAGDTFDQAVAHAQSIGIAETDPSGDVEGWDAAVKVAALVTVLMGQPTTPSDVERVGIGHLDADQVRAAAQGGRRWKLICQAERASGGVESSVAPQQVGPDDPLFHVSGTSSAITFDSDVLGALTLTESDPGPRTTAYGLFADFVRAVTL